MDALRHQTFRILRSQEWVHGLKPAEESSLIGRYYERFTDHAVAIARQVNFQVTGPPPER
jgi:phosphate transport system protein